MRKLILLTTFVLVVTCVKQFEALRIVYLTRRDGVARQSVYKQSQNITKRGLKKYARSRTMTKAEEEIDLKTEQERQNQTSEKLKKLHTMKTVIQDVISKMATDKDQKEIMEKLNDNTKMEKYKDSALIREGSNEKGGKIVEEELPQPDQTKLRYLDTSKTGKTEAINDILPNANGVKKEQVVSHNTGKKETSSVKANLISTSSSVYPVANNSFISEYADNKNGVSKNSIEHGGNTINNHSPTVFMEEDGEKLSKRRYIHNTSYTNDINTKKLNDIKTFIRKTRKELKIKRGKIPTTAKSTTHKLLHQHSGIKKKESKTSKIESKKAFTHTKYINSGTEYVQHVVQDRHKHSETPSSNDVDERNIDINLILPNIQHQQLQPQQQEKSLLSQQKRQQQPQQRDQQHQKDEEEEQNQPTQQQQPQQQYEQPQKQQQEEQQQTQQQPMSATLNPSSLLQSLTNAQQNVPRIQPYPVPNFVPVSSYPSSSSDGVVGHMVSDLTRALDRQQMSNEMQQVSNTIAQTMLNTLILTGHHGEHEADHGDRGYDHHDSSPGCCSNTNSASSINVADLTKAITNVQGGDTNIYNSMAKNAARMFLKEIKKNKPKESDESNVEEIMRVIKQKATPANQEIIFKTEPTSAPEIIIQQEKEPEETMVTLPEVVKRPAVASEQIVETVAQAPASAVIQPPPVVQAPSTQVVAPQPIVQAPPPVVQAPPPVVQAPPSGVQAPSLVAQAPSVAQAQPLVAQAPPPVAQAPPAAQAPLPVALVPPPVAQAPPPTLQQALPQPIVQPPLQTSVQQPPPIGNQPLPPVTQLAPPTVQQAPSIIQAPLPSLGQSPSPIAQQAPTLTEASPPIIQAPAPVSGQQLPPLPPGQQQLGGFQQNRRKRRRRRRRPYRNRKRISKNKNPITQTVNPLTDPAVQPQPPVSQAALSNGSKREHSKILPTEVLERILAKAMDKAANTLYIHKKKSKIHKKKDHIKLKGK
ncbi:uncharacterized protein LOC130647390 [Hydractinia symbiolongicarpus]|uniref:uncharacterized protein LOC130647390 n=1 Tax=Hydractinia symbiolongicarpus TaxID=13093 RepID=UPI00254D36E4|nr:uncharacterized protein LOC130647390 [Hydractinia symbiolongicarpus]